MLTIIPARQGSSRLSGKNVRPFENAMTLPIIKYNLVERTINQAKWLDGKIIVTSDIAPKDLIAHVVPVDTDFTRGQTVFDSDGREIYFIDRTNRAHLNLPETRTEDVIDDVLRMFDDETFCLLQPTSPFRDQKTLLHAQRLFNNDKMTTLISVDGRYQPNGNFYFVRTKEFLEQRTVYLRNSCYYLCEGPMNIDVDYIWDFRIAQAVNEGRIFRGD